MSKVEVLYVDNHLLVLNKPAGLLTQPNNSDAPSLEAWGKEFIKQRAHKSGNVFLHAVHRLDRPVSGIVLFARTSKSLSRLNDFMRQRLVQKEYVALIEGPLQKKEGVLEHYLQRASFCMHSVSKEHEDAKRCALQYAVTKTNGKFSLLQITLITGRYHQIRAQLASIGHPIVGDRKYGSSYPDAPLFLHHQAITFPHPITRKSLHYGLSIPDDWVKNQKKSKYYDLFC